MEDVMVDEPMRARYGFESPQYKRHVTPFTYDAPTLKNYRRSDRNFSDVSPLPILLAASSTHLALLGESRGVATQKKSRAVFKCD